MQRWLVPAACAALALPSLAQQRLDPSRLIPIRGEVRHAGTVDVTTGRWTRRPHVVAASEAAG